MNGRVRGATKKPLENAMKLRESRLSHHLKPIQMMLKRRKFFYCHPQPSNSSADITERREGFNNQYWGCFLLEPNFTFNSAPLL